MIEELEKYLQLGIERNIVIYDRDSNGNYTPRLESLLETFQERNSPRQNKKITDIFIRESKAPEKYSNLIPNWYLVPDEIWDEIESLYRKLNGTFAYNQTNLLITVANSENEITSGLRILNNQAVLLGSF